MSVIRYDSGKLTSVKRTPQGGIRAQAALTRSAVFRYDTPEGPRFEYRPEEEVFNEDSLESLADAPVTSLHHGLVTPENFRRVAVGSLSGRARREDSYVVGDVVIQDAETIAAIEEGTRREVSCGYVCDVELTPGVTPSGERYDAVQRNIRYNHVALVPKGRAGSTVALRLDSAGNQVSAGEDSGQKGKSMEIEIIEGTRYEIGSEAHRKAVSQREDAAGRLAAELEALRDENAQLKSRVEKFDAELGARVQARIDLLARAEKAGVEVRADASDGEVKRQVVTKVLPNFDLEGRSEEYVEGAFAMALERIASGAVESTVVKADHAPTEAPKPADVSAYERMIERNRAQFGGN